MTKPNWFLKLVIILATLSLLLVAMAPLVYLLAPQPVYEDPNAAPVSIETSITETVEVPQ
jgi:hypothetical protein